MIEADRLAQTLLFAGPEGVGKATLARRIGARLLGHGERIEQDDLSLPHNMEIVTEREKMPSEKRNEDPLLFSSHPDFVTFAPDGPLRQISIPQTRLLKERAQFLPMPRQPTHLSHRPCGPRQRAGRELAAEDAGGAARPPDPDHDGGERLRSAADHPFARGAVLFRAAGARTKCAASRRRAGWTDPERRIALAAGSPGAAISLDLDVYDRRRTAMLALLKVAAGASAVRDVDADIRSASGAARARSWSCI